MGGRCRLFLLFCSTAGVAGWTPLPLLPKLVSSRCVSRPAGALCATSVEQHDSKRAKRRRRAPPSELHQWMAVLSERPGGLKLLLDLDNNADAVPQLEAAEVSMQTIAMCAQHTRRTMIVHVCPCQSHMCTGARSYRELRRRRIRWRGL